MIHLVTFANEAMTISGQVCEESGRRQGAQAVWYWRHPGLKQTPFYRENQQLLDQPKGCGYFAWKPFVVLDTLLNRCKPGDILIYSDAGVEFVENVNHVISRMDQDIFLFSNKFQHAHWCKTDIIAAINGTTDWSKFDKQVQASVAFFKVTERSIQFARDWLHF